MQLSNVDTAVALIINRKIKVDMKKAIIDLSPHIITLCVNQIAQQNRNKTKPKKP